MQEAATMRILLIIGGGIAAYKASELVRLIRRDGGSVSDNGRLSDSVE